MAKRRGLLRSYLLTLLVWNPIIVAVIVVAFHGKGSFAGRFGYSILIATIVASFCFATVAVVAAGERWMARRRGRPLPNHSAVWGMALSVAAMPAGLFIAFQVAALVLGAAGRALEPASFADYRFGLFLGATVAGLFFLWETRRDAREATRAAEVRIAESERRQLQAQLAALTAQMNPHLLFNALNTVAALIPSDPEKAEETLLLLADLYRAVLAATRRATHKLSDELALCTTYLALEKARFGERLTGRVDVAIEVAPSTVEVPVLLLQPLLENAIQHGLSASSAAGQVTVSARASDGEIELRVEDDGIGFGKSTRRGAGIALATCRDRLRLCYGDRASLSVAPRAAGGTEAVVRLPREGS